LLFIAKPFTMTYAFIGFLFWSTDKNCIKGTVKLDSAKNNAICKCFDVAALKKAGKHFNGTINDVIMSLVSVSIKEYM
jgi:hypothetical protein